MSGARAFPPVVAAALALLTACLRAAPADAEIRVEIGTVEAAPGAVVTVPVTVHTDGEPLSGFQADLLFEPQIAPVDRGGGRADCRQNPDLLPGELGLHATLPDSGCGGDTTCIRATARLSSAVFPPGPVVVYGCNVQIAPDTASGSYAVRCSRLGTSSQQGEELPARCAAGAILVAGDPVEVTPTVAPHETATPTADGTPMLEIAALGGGPGDRLTLAFHLRAGADPIAGVQADIGFPPAARVAARPDRRPDCAFGADPNFAGYSSVTFQPPGCAGGDECTAIRALLIVADLVRIPDGALLMSCQVDLAADASPGVYAWSLSGLGAATPDGVPVALAASAGPVTVTGDVLDTPPSAVPATATPTPTAVVLTPGVEGGRPIVGAVGSQTSSGCAIPTARPSSSPALLLAPLLLARRRRRRALREREIEASIRVPHAPLLPPSRGLVVVAADDPDHQQPAHSYSSEPSTQMKDWMSIMSRGRRSARSRRTTRPNSSSDA